MEKGVCGCDNNRLIEHRYFLWKFSCAPFYLHQCFVGMPVWTGIAFSKVVIIWHISGDTWLIIFIIILFIFIVTYPFF